MFQLWNGAAVIELADVRAFVRVAELHSISASARAMGAPKSSVSRALSRLEDAIGSTLVERSTRRLRLTDAGELLLPHALRIINEVEEAEAAVGQLVGTPQGTVRVSAPFAFALGALTVMLPDFLARYPAVDVVLLPDAGLADLSAGDADLIVRIAPLPDTSMVAHRLGTVELWTCASPSYLAAHGTPDSVSDLAEHNIIGLTGPEVTWSFRNAAGRMEDVVLHARVVLPDPALIQSALTRGLGIGQLPEYMADDAIRRGELSRILPEVGPAMSVAFALFPSRKGLPIKARVFLDALAAHVASRRRPSSLANPNTARPPGRAL